MRAVSTYLVLILSRLASLVASLFMALAINAFVSKDAGGAIQDIAIFSALTLVPKLFKEMQLLIYLKVKQTAYIELAILTYVQVQSFSGNRDFALHFELAGLSYIAFSSLVVYSYLTIKFTLSRKKYREASMRPDNEYHDKATDALLNYVRPLSILEMTLRN
ncbi:unnamed protein product [Peronospora belbahrii]|uniref:Uncharacterized protein n=1 Tax=Peronospora belbahrii TaxID=622444 RepID=A0AAU9L578_9STRA|nr:unnamed protein product [Peronospora belbahrii]